MNRYWPVNYAKLRLSNRLSKQEEMLTLTEMIDRFGYQVCSVIFNGDHCIYSIKGVRK